MKPIRSARLGPLVLLILGLFAGCCHDAAPELIDDRAITIHSAREVTAKRQALIKYIWGAEGFPKVRLPDVVVPNVPSPVQHLSQLARVDEFRFEQTPDLQGLAYHFIPRTPNRELVVVHQGHGCTLDDDPSPADVGFGLQRTIHALLREGYGVLGVFMPHRRPGDCREGRVHDVLMGTTTNGSPLKYFLDPVAISLNHLKTRSQSGNFPEYRAFHMVGLSGGGWATTVYAAIDPTIRYSFPVAEHFRCISDGAVRWVTVSNMNRRSTAWLVIRTSTSWARRGLAGNSANSGSARQLLFRRGPARQGRGHGLCGITARVRRTRPRRARRDRKRIVSVGN